MRLGTGRKHDTDHTARALRSSGSGSEINPVLALDLPPPVLPISIHVPKSERPGLRALTASRAPQEQEQH
jgi:hypothetical protein